MGSGLQRPFTADKRPRAKCRAAATARRRPHRRLKIVLARSLKHPDRTSPSGGWRSGPRPLGRCL